MIRAKTRVVAVAVLATTVLAVQAQQQGVYAPIDLADLKVDIKQMIGKRVVVSALVQTMGEISMLKSDPLDMAPLWAATDALPRDDRKKLASSCQVVPCRGTFYGVVQRGPLGNTVNLQKADWR
ncbi:MAG: hypothetical protein EOP50_09565 [Sphingobacteriales bacterium]|nr:MAG: hypothetical protein EOP50_09565 [Sphingobacteriales bacterium]